MKRDHRNVGASSSSHNICLKKVRDELPIGPVGRQIAEGLLEDRHECRTRAVKICKAALTIHRAALRREDFGGSAPSVV